MKAASEKQLAELCRMIIIYGTRTGSRVFGVDTKDSDYDYVMLMCDAYAIYRSVGIEPFKEPREDYAGQFISLKYLCRGGWVNLIIVRDDEDLEAWKYATAEMKKMDKNDIREKAKRVEYFGWLLTEYYSYIPKGKHYEAALHMWGKGTVPRNSKGINNE